MVISPSNGYTTTPHHRQNRRRERPGSRTRRTITRKAAMQSEYAEGILDALDDEVRLPTDRSNPSPLLRQNFDHVWQKWKAREAEEKALAELERAERELELEKEQLRLFGGEVDDDELYRLGILYDDEKTAARHKLSTSATASWAVSAFATPPSYLIRHVKPRRSRRRIPYRSLDLYLSFANLRDDHDIARLLSESITTPPPGEPAEEPSVAGRPPPPPLISADEIPSSPQSLPAPMTAAVLSTSSTTNFLSSLPSHALEDWTFITNSPSCDAHPTDLTTPSSEPETWILLGDDS